MFIDNMVNSVLMKCDFELKCLLNIDVCCKELLQIKYICKNVKKKKKKMYTEHFYIHEYTQVRNFKQVVACYVVLRIPPLVHL